MKASSIASLGPSDKFGKDMDHMIIEKTSNQQYGHVH